MKFLKSADGEWINIGRIRSLYVGRQNAIMAVREDRDAIEMSEEFESLEKAQEMLDAVIAVINKDDRK